MLYFGTADEKRLLINAPATPVTALLRLAFVFVSSLGAEFT
jgi:hypothetical protein